MSFVSLILDLDWPFFTFETMINFPAFTSSWGDCRLHGLITLSYIINLELLPWIGHYANRQSDCHSISWYLSGHLESYSYIRVWFMMTSSNGNIFRVTGLLWGEFTGLRWSPLTKANDAELWCFLWSASEKNPVEYTIETPVISDAIAIIMTSL